MACGAAVTGRPPVIWATGKRAPKAAQAVHPDDRWHLGSITKSMTATLAGRLADRGLITFQSTVGEVLAKDYPTLNPAYREVTLWQLFTHRSGMLHDLNLGVMRGNRPKAEIIKLALESKPTERADPSAASYSNLGIAVAGAMLETRGGASWRDLMAAEVFRPLGLSSAGFGHPAGDEPQGQWAPGFVASALRGLSAFGPAYMSAIAPAGDVHMSVPDTLIYLAAHRDRTALLSPETWEFLHRDPLGKGIAMGWGVDPTGKLGHTGSDGFFFAQVLIDPRSGIVAIAAANRGGADGPVREALDGAVASVKG